MSSALSQLSCFSSINRRLRLCNRSAPCITLRPKVWIVMSDGARRTEISSSETKATLSYSADASKSHNGWSTKSYTATEEEAAEEVRSEPVQEHLVTQQRGAAKIHDFCLGIPFGGLVLCGGLVGFIFSRNPASLGTSILLGGALLVLSTLSLNVWRKGKSSIPFILGQAALSVALLWRNYQAFSLTKKLFPVGINVFISGAMLCFYLYVMISGGNPPPRKLRSSATVPS